MKAYRISGTMIVGRQWVIKQPFNWEIAAADAESARERLYAEIGSKHGVPRNKVTISEVTEIKPDEVQNPRVLSALKKGN